MFFISLGDSLSLLLFLLCFLLLCLWFYSCLPPTERFPPPELPAHWLVFSCIHLVVYLHYCVVDFHDYFFQTSYFWFFVWAFLLCILLELTEHIILLIINSPFMGSSNSSYWVTYCLFFFVVWLLNYLLFWSVGLCSPECISYHIKQCVREKGQYPVSSLCSSWSVAKEVKGMSPGEDSSIGGIYCSHLLSFLLTRDPSLNTRKKQQWEKETS